MSVRISRSGASAGPLRRDLSALPAARSPAAPGRRGWTIWDGGPEPEDLALPAPLNLLDVHLDGSEGTYVVQPAAGAAGQAAASMSVPATFSFLPSGAGREVRTTRRGRSLRIALTDDVLHARALARDGLARPLLHLRDEAIVSTAVALSEARARPGTEGCPSEAVESLLTLVLTRVAYLAGRAASPEGAALPRQVGRALAYVDGHLSEPLRLRDVAEAAGISQFHLARLVRASLGRSLHDYIVERRIALAERLIAETEWGLSNIAYKSGFGSQSHMTTVFRRRLGRTPGEMRRARAS